MIDLTLLLHDDESTPGTVLAWCEARGVTYEILVAPEVKDWASLAPRRGAVVFGGDMEVWETEKYPWLKNEKAFLGRAIRAGEGVFGICLGGQLAAEQLGAEVHPLEHPQIGWFPVVLEGGASLCPLAWHNSEFTLPPATKLLAHAPGFSALGFSAEGGRVRGFQFHTEIDEVRLAELLSRWQKNPKAHQQSAGEIHERARALLLPLRDWCFAELDHWWQAVCKKT